MPTTYIAEPAKLLEASKLVADELNLPARGRLRSRMVIGRREWLALPEFGIDMLTAKVDTGAYTSSLNAIDAQIYDNGGEQWVSFKTVSHHGQVIACEAPLVSRKKIKSSTGVGKNRLVIKTAVTLPGGFRWEVLFSLADRSVMKCPLLLGRRALSGYFVVDTQSSHLFGNSIYFSGKSHHHSL
ncbi:MAG: RimK/LysX family protein [Akkermansiaceae bacterium]|nr:RimK/LysX family protein [Akkermansiaceae bacterium]